MFNIDFASALGIIIRTTAVYLVILIGLRLAGKREIGQMTVFDLVALHFLPTTFPGAENRRQRRQPVCYYNWPLITVL